MRRLGSLHLNDSQTPLGSNRDRHANIGTGELGESGCAAFLSEPRFDKLPCVLETNGPDRTGPHARGDRPLLHAAQARPGVAQAQPRPAQQGRELTPCHARPAT